MKDVQLPLFDSIQTSTQNEVKSKTLEGVNWSFSRRSTLEQCAKKYYYEYYGSNKKVALSHPGKDRLYLLKKVENRYARTGNILHFVISQFFRQAQSGIAWDLNKLQGWAKNMFIKDIEYSEAHPDGSFEVKEKYPPILLQEFHSSLPNAKVVCFEALGRMLDALRSFYLDETFSFYREAGKRNDSMIERMFKLKNATCRIDGKIDLAFKDNNKVIILDWKSGRSDGGGDDSLQLIAYAIWGVDYFQCDPDNIKILKAYLTESLVAEFQINTRMLEAASARIQQDAERMRNVIHYGKDGIEGAFTASAYKSVCQLCSYISVCEEGKVSLYD